MCERTCARLTPSQPPHIITKQYLCVNNEKNNLPGCPLQNAPSQLPDNSGCMNCLVRACVRASLNALIHVCVCICTNEHINTHGTKQVGMQLSTPPNPPPRQTNHTPEMRLRQLPLRQCRPLHPRARHGYRLWLARRARVGGRVDVFAHGERVHAAAPAGELDGVMCR